MVNVIILVAVFNVSDDQTTPTVVHYRRPEELTAKRPPLPKNTAPLEEAAPDTTLWLVGLGLGLDEDWLELMMTSCWDGVGNEKGGWK